MDNRDLYWKKKGLQLAKAAAVCLRCIIPHPGAGWVDGSLGAAIPLQTDL